MQQRFLLQILLLRASNKICNKNLCCKLGTFASSVGGSNPERNGSTKAHTPTLHRISEHCSVQTFCYCRVVCLLWIVTAALRWFDLRNC